jgi:hypothetical protein
MPISPEDVVSASNRCAESRGPDDRRVACRHQSQSLPGMMRFMNSSNIGTVKAVSP